MQLRSSTDRSKRILMAALLASVFATQAGAAMLRAAIPGTDVVGGGVYLPPPPPPETTPRAPYGTHVALKTTDSLSIAWRDDSQVESGYRIERRSGTAWIVVAQIPAVAGTGLAEWRTTGLTHDTEYCFRAVPWNAYGAPVAVPEACTRTNRLVGTRRAVVTDRAGLLGELADPTPPRFQHSALLLSDGFVASAPPTPAAFPVPPSIKEIYVADYAVIDLSYLSLRVPAGITLLSGRGGLRQGALLYSTALSVAILEVTGDNVRISGLRFRGPSSSTSQDHAGTYAIAVRNARDVVIDNNEFYWWPGAGVRVQHARGLLHPLTAYRVRIVGNFFHHNQRQNLGYGVVVKDASYAVIDRNTFDWNRHAIASDGGRNVIVPGYGPEHGFLAYLNLVLPGHAEQEYVAGLIGRQTHHFDVHGSESNWLGVDYYDGWAGEFIDIADNSFLGVQGTAFNIRGTPSIAARFHRNVVPMSVPFPNTNAVFGLDGGVSWYGWWSVNSESDRDNVEVFSNQPLPDPRARLAVGDFDGDGRDDVFLATGRAWYVSYGGITEWRFLNAARHLLPALSFADVDGDGRTDVLTRVGSSWRVASRGEGAFVPLATPPVLPPQGSYSGDDLVGDFTGDDVLDRLRFDRTGDRYFRTTDGRTGTTVRSRHQM